MRLFTAIELADVVRIEAAGLTAELRRRVQEQAPRARLTWAAAERLHLTVRFLGDLEDELAERVIGALREPLPINPFAMTFDPLGAFPAKGPPRVLWIAAADGRDDVIRAGAAISDRLLALGIPAEDRAYTPHLTLARVRDAGGLRPAALFDGLVSRLGPTRVDAITLFESRLSPKGPTYTVLERTRLHAAIRGARKPDARSARRAKPPV